MPLPQLPGSLYISLRTCFLTKIIIIHINSSFSASFLRNAGKNSLFHTVGYKNHSVGYIFHTVKYKSRTVEQRIYKGISKNTCSELQLILPANQINPMKFPAHTPATSILLAAPPRHSWPMLPFHPHQELPQSEPGLPAIHATPECNSH